MRKLLLLRNSLLSLMLGLLLSCGGGGGGSTDGSVSGGPSAFGTVDAPGSPGGASNGIGGISVDDGPTSSAGGIGTSSASSGTGGTGVGSGGTGTTASAGDDGTGVGSGGTGVSTADATGVGSVDGAGSIIINGLRYDTSTAIGKVEDAPNGLQLGMSAKVTGPVNADFTQGVARSVESAADLRGTVAAVNSAQGSFVVLGITVTVDEATVWADAGGIAAIQAGQFLQVWGLPGAPGVLRATRIEQRAPSALVITDTVQNLDVARRTFTLGNAVVDYSRVAPGGSLDGRPLANGTIVRVRADQIMPGDLLIATQVQWWYPVPTAEQSIAQLAGIVTDFSGLGSLRVLGLPVDASAAQISGGQAGSIGNGVKVEVGGVVSNGALRATKLKIRHVPGTGGPASFDLRGNIGAFKSPSDFKVRGQAINAGGAGVVFLNGGPANLGNGVRIRVQGSRVVDGVLIAQSIAFQ